MTQPRAPTIANIAIGAAGVVAAVLILRNPTLRRAAARVLKIGLTTTIPGYLLKEAADAWRETGHHAA